MLVLSYNCKNLSLEIISQREPWLIIGEAWKNGIHRVRYNAAINRAIRTRHKTLIHEMIDDKKKEDYKSGIECRKSKTGEIYEGYLYCQKRMLMAKTRDHFL